LHKPHQHLGTHQASEVLACIRRGPYRLASFGYGRMTQDVTAQRNGPCQMKTPDSESTPNSGLTAKLEHRR